MSTAIETPQEQAAPEMDAKQLATFMEARNKGEAIPKPAAKVETAAPVTEEPKQASSRSQRRALRAAEERTANLVLETLTKAGVIKKEAEPEAVEVEPKRADFPAGDEGMAQFVRATQKWDKTQEAKTEAAKGTETAQTEELKTFLGEMDTKAAEDMKSLKDWDKVMKTAQDHEDLPEFIPDEQPILMSLLSRSDMRAFVLYHFAKPENFEAFEDLLALSKTPDQQIKSFHRLEGRLEKMYDADRSEKTEAAQADPEKEKTASTPQKPQGRAEPQQEAQPAKPKPSSEVAARGGSPAPEEPAIGSPAWMLKRNQAQFGH